MKIMNINSDIVPNLFGLKVITDIYMVDRKQVKFPRSKKKRIRKKWAKNQDNYRWIPWDKVYQMGDTLIMHPSMLEKLKKQLNNDNNNRS